jgi:hypothetical protein
MMDTESKCKILEAQEILTNVQEVRNIQRQFTDSTNPHVSAVTKEFFQESFKNFLKNNELSKRKSLNQSQNSGMEEEGKSGNNFNSVPDMFFLYPTKCQNLVPSMLQVAQNLYNSADLSQEDHKQRMKIMANLLYKMLLNNQNLRT